MIINETVTFCFGSGFKEMNVISHPAMKYSNRPLFMHYFCIISEGCQILNHIKTALF